MGKAASPFLFNLVHSLTSSEKKYLKLMTRSDKNEITISLKLFNAIEKEKMFDEQKIYYSLRNDIQDYNNFRVAKNNLYHLILKMMQQYHSLDSSVDIQLANDAEHIRFLYEKRLFDQASKMLAKAKKLATEYERFFALADLIRWEIKIAVSMMRKGRRTPVRPLFIEAQEAVDNIKSGFALINIDARIEELVTTANIASFERAKEFRQLLMSDVFSKENLSKSVEAKLLHFYINDIAGENELPSLQDVDWHGKKDRYEEFIRELKKEGKYHIVTTFPDRHFALFHNYLRSGNNTTLEIAVKVLSAYKREKFQNEASRITQYNMGFYVSLRLSFASGDKKLFLDTLKEFLPPFERTEHSLPADTRMMIYSGLGELYLMHGQLRMAERSYKKLITLAKQAPKLRIDMVRIAYLMVALINGEMHSKSKLYRSIKAAKDNIRVISGLNKIDQCILELLHKLLLAKNKEERKEAIEVFVLRMEELRETKEWKVAVSFFNFADWFKSKIDNESFIAKTRRANGIQ